MSSFIPDDKINMHLPFNITPMIDFIFIMFSFFAILALSKVSLMQTNLDLVNVKNTNNTNITTAPYQINVSISQNGKYNWITQSYNYSMDNPEKIQKELLYQYTNGLIPQDKTKTQVLLHVDKNAPWESVAKLIFAVKEIGFEANPIYQKGATPHERR
jgi:biopolymer transport protein ExbD